MPLRLFSSDACFQAGLSALQHRISAGYGLNAYIHSLYFPDMRYLQAWSQKPILPVGDIVIIAGSKRVISMMSDIVNPERVLLSPGGEALSSLTERICLMVNLPASATGRHKPEILLTSREMSYMWAFMHGHLRQSDSKRDSAIRRAVMAKIGATDQLSLLIRFRLLLFMDSYYLLKHVRMRNSNVKALRRQERWLYLQELRDVGAQAINDAHFKK
ncbi:TPA: hypothetical protein RFU08_003383 [Klebsiella pneumoniae subsp. pneumoniae]|uniref:hypothetical protein n=1 Tax=Klebsiella pneumoniae TaxID=573 RepID=UPI00081C2B1F|nr:hypothetical protein [Klebsiella pneumoniae]HDU4886374.1 hypothetical protein [Klebsiella pneumoniae subsp. pneumoniae]MCP5665857.1 hypothetical protein [Klebsiella pneumoniae]MCP5726433.1 hypothetical protein [Klebsiella pneumoniae]MCP6688753.1 hypothetical protein [Klebsiella pneumoniae]MCQ8407559.1 hypothetical protein [Klebsiella pneumoniae]